MYSSIETREAAILRAMERVKDPQAFKLAIKKYSKGKGNGNAAMARQIIKYLKERDKS